MKRTCSTIAALTAASLALAACENPPTKQQTGTVAGAVVGGVVGSTIGGGTGRTVAIVAGTIAGGLLGSHIGKRMDEADRIKAGQALESTRTGETSTWRNPDTGDQYAVTPTTHLQDGQRPVPRLHGQRDRRRQAREGRGHRVPPGRRKLEADELRRG